MLEARRRRTDALANLITEDDDDLLLGLGETKTNSDDKQSEPDITALLSGNDDEISMPSTPPSFAMRQRKKVDTTVSSPSRVSNDNGPLFGERKLRPSRFHEQQPSRTLAVPPGKLNANEPPNEEVDDTTSSTKNEAPVSPRQRYLQNKKISNKFIPPASPGGNSSVASKTESELQMRLRDRFNRAQQNIDTSIGNQVKREEVSSVSKTDMKWNPTKTIEVEEPEEVIETKAQSQLSKQQPQQQQQQQQQQQRAPSPVPQLQSATSRAPRASAGFFTRTSPSLRASSSGSTFNNSLGSSLNSNGSNSNISGRSGSGGSINRNDGSNRGTDQSRPLSFKPPTENKVVGEIDWPSEDNDTATQHQSETSPTPSSTIQSTTTATAPISPSRQIGGRNTTGGFSRTVAGRSSRSSSSTYNPTTGTGSPDYRGRSNPQMLSFMAKKYKESKSGSPRSAEKERANDNVDSPSQVGHIENKELQQVEAATKKDQKNDVEAVKQKSQVEKIEVKKKVEVEKRMPMVPASPKSDVPEFMGVRLRKTNRTGAGTGAVTGGVSTKSGTDKPSDSPKLVEKSVSTPSETVIEDKATPIVEESKQSRNKSVQRRWQPQQKQVAPQSKAPSRSVGSGNVANRYPPAIATPANDSNDGSSNKNNVGKLASNRFHQVAATTVSNNAVTEAEEKEETTTKVEEDSVNEQEIINDFANFDLMDDQAFGVGEEEAELEESPPKQNDKYVFNNYDTAVMAAKEAITASNLNRMKDFAEQEEPSPLDPVSPVGDNLATTPTRQQPWHRKNDQQLVEEAYGESILDNRADGDRDPSPRMEQSMTGDMLPTSNDYPFLDSLVTKEEERLGGSPLDMVYSTDRSEEGDRHYMSPASTAEEDVSADSKQNVNSFFGTSFLAPKEDDSEEDENAVNSNDLFHFDPFEKIPSGALSHESPSNIDEVDLRITRSDSSSVEEEQQTPATPRFEANFDEIPSNESDDYVEEEIKPRMSSESMLGYSFSPSGTETSFDLSPRASSETMGEFKADAGDLIEDTTYEDEVVDELPPVHHATLLYDDVQQPSYSANEHDIIPGSFIIQPLQFPLDVANGGGLEPKTNPLTGNLIVCTSNGTGNFFIKEVDISRNKPITVLSANFLTNELKMRLSRSSAVSKNTKIVGVNSVLSLTAGVHRVQGRARVRVAALAEVLVIGNSKNGAMSKLRLVAVWKWGYNPGGVSLASLQSVLTTKTIDNSSFQYNPATLQVADGLLFLGGRDMSAGPVVFIAKPAVRDSWTSVPITNSTAETVSALATSNDTNPYVAVGFNDGRISVWSYDIAVRTNRISAGQTTSLLRLLHHIRGELDVSDLSDSDCLWPHDRFFTKTSSSSSQSQKYTPASIEEAQCSSLSWIKPSSSGISSLSLLAASFSSGIAVYHIRSEDDKQTSVPEIIPPLAQAKFLTHDEESDINEVTATTSIDFRKPRGILTWYDLGPRSSPCLAMIFQHEQVSFDTTTATVVEKTAVHRLCLCAIDIPWYGSSELVDLETKQDHRAIGVLCQNDVNLTSPVILDSPTTGSIVCYTGGNFLTFHPTLASASSSRIKADGFFSSLSCPVSSSILGLDSNGGVYLGNVDAAIKSKYNDIALSVFSLLSCNGEEEESELTPSLRYWLLISNSGDRKMEALPHDQRIDDSSKGDDEVIKTGAVTDVLCELTCGENPVSGLVPSRLVKEEGGLRVAVLYSTDHFGGNAGLSEGEWNRSRTQTRINPSPVAYAVIDLDEAMKCRGLTPFTLRHGRDVAFLPPTQSVDGSYCSALVVLDPSGLSISTTTIIRTSPVSEGGDEAVVESIGKCSLHYEGIEGHRVFALFNCNNLEVLVAGYSEDVGLPCLVVCKHSLEKDSNSNQLNLVEGTDQGHRLWLKAGEEVIALVELPSQNQSSRSNIAVATQQRVLILSMVGSISIIAEVEAFLTCTTLSPIGSHCVAFSASTGPCGGGISRIMYLSCLQNVGNHGIISILPSPGNVKSNTLLTAVRPDRIIYTDSQGGIRHAIEENDGSSFAVPLSHTRPVFLLEPLVANALCQDKWLGSNAAKSSDVQSLLRTIIEKFGRKESSFPHSDSEGIGSFGAGITMKVYDMLLHHGCTQAASLLLTGNAPGDVISQPTILPPWVPMSSKVSVTKGGNEALQVLSSGDYKLAEYLRNCDREPQILPKPNDPSSILALKLAIRAISDDKINDAAKLLDFSGHQSSENILLQLPMSRSSSVEPILRRILAESGSSQQAIKSYTEVLSSIGLGINDATLMSQLAPSVQKARRSGRSRTGVIDSSLIDSAFPKQGANENFDPAWKDEVNESKHVWSAGPFGKKEELLQLDDFVDWFGRCRPVVLGKEGVAMAADTGEQALANILLAAAQEDMDQGSDDNETEDSSIDGIRKNWIEGVGEGHLDEDNLSLYMRFSEGADEDCNWQTDGFADLTKHKHQARIYGSELVSLEATTSSVDEGEEGKVRLLYDVVFNDGAPRERSTGVAVEVSRGGHLDVGMLHSSDDKARQRCTLEMWYHLPQAHLLTDEIILMRRSLFYEENDDVSKLCLPDERHNTLWELAVLPTGLLELRTGAGSVVTSAMFIKDDDDGLKGLVSWERESGGGGWNHVCVTFNSMEKGSPSEVSAAIMMNGATVVPSTEISVDPFGVPEDVPQDDIDDALEKSILIFGIGPSPGFRMTDIRVWACQRAEDDIQMMMYEYLKDAEMKRKFKVNIRKSSTGMLAPPARLAQPERKKFTLTPPKAPQPNRTPPRPIPYDDGFGVDDVKFEPTFAVFDKIEPAQNEPTDPEPSSSEIAQDKVQNLEQSADSIIEVSSEIAPPFEVEVSDLLSTKVKSSAAAAIIRGPPAARHFGGNRGGLISAHTNFGLKPDGVSPIAISGPDKSLVFFSDRDPPGRTYPIGASGAVLSDIMDEKYSEYMCCFLAREKRMIIFELTRKTVVVELQMKTKLNFWRYLPPEAHGGELAFVLITPIGGFYWKPLENPPRPKLVWKRSAELESKKVITYEEGGSNGLLGADARSTVALILVSSPVSTDANVEAYCISMDGDSSQLFLSDDILGAALCRPPTTASAQFLPFVVTVQSDYDTSQLVLNVWDLKRDEFDGNSLVRGGTMASAVLDLTDVSDESFDPPPMSMGISPEVLICCNQDFIVAVIRSRGIIFAYDICETTVSSDLANIGKYELGRYIVDAAIRPNGDNEVELVALVRESNDSKDGRIATIVITR